VKAPADDRVAFIKALRTVGGISLKRANEIAAHLDRFRNSTLVAGITQRTAEHIAKALDSTGAAVVVRESAVTTPMMCVPEADQRYKWSGLRTLVKTR
jgi:ribosomal protein S13